MDYCCDIRRGLTAAGTTGICGPYKRDKTAGGCTRYGCHEVTKDKSDLNNRLLDVRREIHLRNRLLVQFEACIDEQPACAYC